MRRTAATLCLLVAVTGAGCGGGSSSSDDDATATSTSSPPTSAASTTTTAAPCPPGGAAPGPGWEALQWESTDFDGDGRADGMYRNADEVNRLRIVPTTGVPNEVRVPTAKPYGHLSGIDVDGNRHQEAMIGVYGPDDMRVRLLVFADCKVDWLLNEQGQPYEFSAKGGDTTGDGVGCVDNDGDGRVDLVGIHYDPQGADLGWVRTTVRIEGRRGVNGERRSGTFRHDDSRAREASSSATCGDKVLTDE